MNYRERYEDMIDSLNLPVPKPIKILVCDWAQKYFCAQSESTPFRVTFVTSYSKEFADKLFDRLFAILIQPVQEKFPRPIKLERTGISAETRETTRTKMAQVHGLNSKINYRTLEFTNLPSISPQSDFLFDCLFAILIQPVQEKFPRPIKLERTGISAETRETTRTKMAQVHGLNSKINYRTLEFTNLPSISPQSDFLSWCFFRLVYKHGKFGDFFRFHGSPFTGTLLQEAGKYGEQAIKQFVSELLRIRSHECNMKRAGLWLGTKIYLCPITDKDFNWFRNWSVKSRIPGAPLLFL